jgi:hypothetical protein
VAAEREDPQARSKADDDEEQAKSAPDLLEDWREAEGSAEDPDATTADAKMARRRADVARETFHAREDEEHERAGDHRPRSTGEPT